MAHSLLLEIGCEELPTSFVRGALEQLERTVPEEFARARIAHGAVRTLGTPRRLAVLLGAVAEQVAPRTEVLTGPAESAARARDGSWTKAAEGFARKNDVSLDAVTVIDTPKGRYVQAERVHPGGPSAERLPAVLEAIVAKIVFAKSMRWADVEVPFGRPVHWLVALYGDAIVPMRFIGHAAGRTTRGHRFLAPDPIELPSADAYVDRLRAAHVIVEVEERRRAQHAALERAAREAGGTLVRNPSLEEEVLGLVEQPFAVVGHFDAAYLDLPEELIETVMSHHQRYFAARGRDGALLPAFITTVNTALDAAAIRKGNERVMRARLADARFFVAQDRTIRLDARVAKLDGVIYHPKLGTYGDKVARLERLAPWVAEHLDADAAHAERAAHLAKADLLSLAVGEFPELQGIMGRHYARHDGEPAAVADAIAEHYLPRAAEDSVAERKVGAALAIADRLDTLVGFFAIGLKPSGAGDPFGLRRAALGLLRTLIHHRARLSLAVATGRAYALYARELPRTVDETGRDVTEFVRERLEHVLVQKHALDVVRACIAAGHDDPVDVLERVEALSGFRGQPEFARVVKAFERVFNISRAAPAGEPDPRHLTLPAEIGLVEAYRVVRPQLQRHIDEREFASAIRALAEGLPTAVDRFFTEVFVMDDAHPELRDARLRLLGRIAEDVGTIARFDTLAATDAAP